MNSPTSSLRRPRSRRHRLLVGRLGERIGAAIEAVQAHGREVGLDVVPNGHGVLVTVSLDGRPVLGPVAPELAEAFLLGVGCAKNGG